MTFHLCPHNTNMAALKTAFLFLLMPILGLSENKDAHQFSWLIILILLSSMSPVLLNPNLAGKISTQICLGGQGL